MRERFIKGSVLDICIFSLGTFSVPFSETGQFLIFACFLSDGDRGCGGAGFPRFSGDVPERRSVTGLCRPTTCPVEFTRFIRTTKAGCKPALRRGANGPGPPGTGLGHRFKRVGPEFMALIGLAPISRWLPGKINTKMKKCKDEDT